MSLATWKTEFYPVPAADVPADMAVAHSLQKWRGLTAENLSRHDIRRGVFGRIEDVDGGTLPISVETCALCQLYFEDLEDDDDFDAGRTCSDCPLSKARGVTACDDERDDEKKSPYQVWVDHGNPNPMIQWLEKAQALAAVDPVGGLGTEGPRAAESI